MGKTIGCLLGALVLICIFIASMPATSTQIKAMPEPAPFEPGPIIGDMLIPDDINRSNRSYRSLPGYYDTSEYMIGDVMVGIIFMESNGAVDSSTEDWTSTEKSNVISEIQAGLNWWAAREPNAHLTFTYDINYGVPTSYEPITRNSASGGSHWLWINEATDYLGYQNDSLTGVRDYINAIRTANNNDWTFAIFVVDSSADSNGQFADGYFAYACLGGPFMVMTYKNDGYGISNMDAVTAHEVGHIFYALDEYSGSTPGPTGSSGYLNIENQNHQDGGSSNVACIMRGDIPPYTNGNICTYTRQMVGWRDTDGDGILDIVDNFPNTSLNTYSPDPTNDNTPTYTGSASEVPYPNSNPYGMGNDVSINTITNVQYRVDGGSWISATASDGAFDEYSEDYTFTTSGLLDGTHTIEVRATNSVGNIETTYASDTITIETTAPTVTAVTPIANETNVSVTTTVTKTFSEPMNKTATEGAFNLYSDGGGTPVAGTKSWSGNQLIFTPDSPLSWNTKYWANVSTAAKDLAGDSLASANNTWFRTVQKGTAMATGPMGYSTVTGITLTYDWTGTPTSVKLYYSKNGNVTWNLAGSDSSVDGSYAYTITSGDGTYGWIAVAIGGGSTETDPLPSGTSAEAYPLILDTQPPLIMATSPAADATNVSIAATVTVTFTEAMNKTSTEDAFNLYLDGSVTPVAGMKSWFGNQLIFTPGSPLSWDTKYWANVSTVAKDLAGNPLASADSVWFGTATTATATVTKPTEYTNSSQVTLTYSWAGIPTSVKLYYSKDGNVTWNLVGSDSSIDGSYTYTITSGDGTYGWTAVAVGGGSAETDPPVSGTTAETYPLILDTVSPNISITGVVNEAYYNVSVTPVIEISDINLNTTNITLNGTIFVSGTTIATEGNYILYTQATDKAGNSATRTMSFSIDKTKPTIEITGVTNNTYYNVSVTPVVGIIDINLNTSIITLNGQSFTSDTTVTADGNYVLFVQAIDKAGNTANKSVSFTIDKTLPEITVSGVANNTYYNVSITPTISVIDINLNISIITLNGQPFTSGSTITDDGDYILFVQAVDKASNTMSKSVLFTIDKILPKITVIGVVDNVYYNVSVIPVVEFNDTNLNVTTITLNGQSFISGTTVTVDGNYILFVQAVDKAGNTASKNVSFIIDKTLPEIAVTGIANNAYYNVTLTPVVDITDLNLNTTLITLNGETFTSGDTVIEEGDYVLFVQATDKANNIAIKTISFAIDKTLPKITIDSVVDGFYYNFSVTPVIELNDANLNITTITLNGVSFESGTTILGEENYILFVEATDKAGNVARKTVTFVIDKKEPEIANIHATPSVEAQNGYVNITCSVIDNFVVNIINLSITGPADFTPVNITMIQIPNTNNHYYNSTYPVAGTYSYYIRVNDTSGNENKSTEYHFTITIAIATTVDNRAVNVTGIGNGTINRTIVTPPRPPPENLRYITCINVTISGELTYINITIKYSDEDVVGLKETTLKMYCWTGAEWKKCNATGVDIVNHIVWANVTHLTIFALFAEKVTSAPPIEGTLPAHLFLNTEIIVGIIATCGIIGITLAKYRRRVVTRSEAVRVERPTMRLRCPACKKIFEIESQKRPFNIKCPHCGEEGVVK